MPRGASDQASKIRDLLVPLAEMESNDVISGRTFQGVVFLCVFINITFIFIFTSYLKDNQVHYFFLLFSTFSVCLDPTMNGRLLLTVGRKYLVN